MESDPKIVRLAGPPSPLVRAALGRLNHPLDWVGFADLSASQNSHLDGFIPTETRTYGRLRRLAWERGEAPQYDLRDEEDHRDPTKEGTRLGLRADFVPNGVPQPEWVTAESGHWATEFVRHMGPPLAIIPNDDPLGRHERRVNDPVDAPLVYVQATSADNQWVTVEEWVRGPTYDVYGWSVGGHCAIAAIAELELAGEPYRFPVVSAYPARIDEVLERELHTVCRNALDALACDRGVFRISVCYPDPERGPIVMSAALGLNEILDPLDITYACGAADLTAAAIALASGDEPAPPSTRRYACAIHWLHARSGKVTAIEGVDEARAVDGVLAVEVAAQVGDVLGHIINAATRDTLGFVAASAPTTAEAIAHARWAADQIRIITATIL